MELSEAEQRHMDVLRAKQIDPSDATAALDMEEADARAAPATKIPTLGEVRDVVTESLKEVREQDEQRRHRETAQSDLQQVVMSTIKGCGIEQIAEAPAWKVTQLEGQALAKLKTDPRINAMSAEEMQTALGECTKLAIDDEMKFAAGTTKTETKADLAKRLDAIETGGGGGAGRSAGQREHASVSTVDSDFQFGAMEQRYPTQAEIDHATAVAGEAYFKSRS